MERVWPHKTKLLQATTEQLRYFFLQQNVQVMLEHYEVKKENFGIATCTLYFHCLSTFPIAKCVITISPVLCLASQRDVTRLCGLISRYNNIIELLIRCFCALHDTNKWQVNFPFQWTFKAHSQHFWCTRSGVLCSVAVVQFERSSITIHTRETNCAELI